MLTRIPGFDAAIEMINIVSVYVERKSTTERVDTRWCVYVTTDDGRTTGIYLGTYPNKEIADAIMGDIQEITNELQTRRLHNLCISADGFQNSRFDPTLVEQIWTEPSSGDGWCVQISFKNRSVVKSILYPNETFASAQIHTIWEDIRIALSYLKGGPDMTDAFKQRQLTRDNLVS